MSYAWIQDVPIDRVVYGRIREALGSEPPKGLILHLAIEQEQGLRYVDVWESEEDCERFTEERLHPVVGRALASAGAPMPDTEPPRRPVNVIDLWSP